MAFLRNSDPEQAVFLWGVALLHSIADAHGRGMDPEGQLHAEVAAAHALLDLRNLLRAVNWGLVELPLDHPMRRDLAAFDPRFPNIVAARDALEHFDEYSTGQGRLQRKTGDTYGWHFFVERLSPESVVAWVGPFSVDLTELGTAASEFVALMSAGIDKAPTPGNVYAHWYARNGYPLTDYEAPGV